MDNNEFVKKFEEKVKIAKEGDAERRKELDELKKKLIARIQQEFLEAIPEELPLNQEFWISSKYIRSEYKKGNYFVDDVEFNGFIRLENFMKAIGKELSDMLNRKVEVTSDKIAALGYDFEFKTCC